MSKHDTTLKKMTRVPINTLGMPKKKMLFSNRAPKKTLKDNQGARKHAKVKFVLVHDSWIKLDWMKWFINTIHITQRVFSIAFFASMCWEEKSCMHM